jgi:hypothetical protein
MKRTRFVAIVLAVLALALPALISAQGAQNRSAGTATLVGRAGQSAQDNSAPYGFVELVGPATYSVVQDDTLWDLSPNNWRILQAHPRNAKLQESWRSTVMPDGRYRVHLNVNESIFVPQGMTVRMRLTRPENYVDNPLTGGPAFIQGGVSESDHQAIRNALISSAARQADIPLDRFEIVGDIEAGRIDGLGTVTFADNPTLARPTRFNGQRAYRGVVRDRQTGEQSQRIFLQGCGNDARQGVQVTAAGDGFRFTPGGITVPGQNPPRQDNPQPRSNLWFAFWTVVAILLALLLAFILAAAYAPEWTRRQIAAARNRFQRGQAQEVMSVVPEQPVGPVVPPAPPVQETTELPPAPPAIAETAPLPALQMVSNRTDTPSVTVQINGQSIKAPANTVITIRGGNEAEVTTADGPITITTRAPRRSKPRAVTSKPSVATGTHGPSGTDDNN